VMQIGFKQMLFDAPLKELRVSPDRIFSFQSNQYPANNLYGGIYLDSLKKHFYRAIGAMNDEEARCANALNNMPKVKYWVRNIERYPEFSFWLPTPTDKFYPDFVAQLENGKVLVVEYKGGHLIDTADTAQKQAIGELWAKRSNKHCMFLLVSDNDYEARLQTAIG
jgi:type III restriction enzyme